jgi:hypothetical protein
MSAVMASLVPLAASQFTGVDFQATLHAAADVSALLGVASAFYAWLAWRDGLDLAGIADAAGAGLALAFLPALAVGGYSYLDISLGGGLSP